MNPNLELYPSVTLAKMFLSTVLGPKLKEEVEVADPGFPPAGWANSQKCYYFSNFLQKNCMKMKEFGPRGGGIPGAPLGSVNEYWRYHVYVEIIWVIQMLCHDDAK